MEHSSATVLGVAIPSTDPFFLAVVGVHVLFGLGCIISGLVAMLANKGRGRHSTFGTIYFWCMSGVFLTMAILAAIRWLEDAVLFGLGALAFALALGGRLAARRWSLRVHASCMGGSYIVLVTAFYVDNGKSLAVWRDLPSVAYWTIPALIGIPLILRVLTKHPLLRG